MGTHLALCERIGQTVTTATVKVVGNVDSDAPLRSLRQWLNSEPTLRGRVDFVQLPPSPGKLGSVADTLMVALASGGALTVLAQSVSVWLQQRHSEIVIEIREENGRTTSISAKGKVADDFVGDS